MREHQAALARWKRRGVGWRSSSANCDARSSARNPRSCSADQCQPAAGRRGDRPGRSRCRAGKGRSRHQGQIGRAALPARIRNRGQLPAHLPRVERIIEPESTLCPCGCGEMTKIGEDVSERLDVIPAQLRVLVTRRPKYACRRCSGAVAQAHAPEHVVPGDLPTEALIAQVIVAKFGDHLPFYRQAEIYARQGIRLDRATLGNWAGRACFHLQPIAASHAPASGCGGLACSWTRPRRRCSIPGAAKRRRASSGRSPPTTGAMAAPSPPIVLFRYAPGRSGAFAEQFLHGFSGRFLQCDGYDGYDRLTRIQRAAQGPWTLVHCWSHLRRRFVKQMRNTQIADRRSRRTADRRPLRGRGNRARHAAGRPARRTPGTSRRRSSTRCSPWFEKQLSMISSGSTLGRPTSATPSLTGRASPGSSMMAGSSSTPTRSRTPSGLWRSVFHYALHIQVSVNIGSVLASMMRHGRPFRATAVLIGSDARSAARI